MIREKLYFKTVDILQQAYFNDTLEHGHPCACGIGNIIAANLGYKIIHCKPLAGLHWFDGDMIMTESWSSVFATSRFFFLIDDRVAAFQSFWPDNYKGKAKAEIDSTGYSWKELAKMEYAFESADNGNSEDECMFNGLMAMIKVLDEIHENTDLEVSANSGRGFKPCSV